MSNSLLSKEDFLNCDQCEYVGSKLSELHTHKLSNHKLKLKLKHHQQTKHEELAYNCDECPAQFTRKSKLEEHTFIRHEGGKFYCDTCNAQYATKAGLKGHKLVQNEGHRYSCHKCDMKYK